MDRRNFIRFGVAATAGGLIVPSLSLAEGTMSGAGGIYYTKDKPGRWAAKACGHATLIMLKKTCAETTVEVVTTYEKKQYVHYTIKHMLLNKD